MYLILSPVNGVVLKCVYFGSCERRCVAMHVLLSPVNDMYVLLSHYGVVLQYMYLCLL